jgi:hypothetical protein
MRAAAGTANSASFSFSDRIKRAVRIFLTSEIGIRWPQHWAGKSDTSLVDLSNSVDMQSRQ